MKNEHYSFYEGEINMQVLAILLGCAFFVELMMIMGSVFKEYFNSKNEDTEPSEI